MPGKSSHFAASCKNFWGVFVLHDDFGEVFGVNLQRASTRSPGFRGFLAIRCSDDILITQVVDPGEEAHIDTHESFNNDTSLYIQMLSVEETQSFSLSLENKRGIRTELPTVDSVSAYLECVQDEVAAVLIAKRTLLRAKNYSDAIEMRSTIDERINDIALKFGSQVPKSNQYRFPKEVSLLPELLLHLRRGPLLGSIVGHEDGRFVLQNSFLNASFDLSLQMVAPCCLMHREGGTFEELPAYDLAMQSDAAVVRDHGTDVFIWLVNFTSSRKLSGLISCIAAHTWPAYKDPPYEHEARFPHLRTLTIEQWTKLKSSFISFDDPSFCERVRSLRLVPPETS
ncbi:hypothetical protein M0R45_006209 [Rubus argutus]|uniref:Protein transport protein SEC23 n=1 Tax=Rubus argutus TaxID=59490 RepID=A0AAW1YQB8_RUBAR